MSTSPLCAIAMGKGIGKITDWDLDGDDLDVGLGLEVASFGYAWLGSGNPH